MNKQNEIVLCEYCSFEYSENENFCPKCGIPNTTNVEKDFFICPVCEAKNPIGERKCNYCCSLF